MHKKRCNFTLEIAEWKSTISFPRRLPNLLRTSLCQESYFKLTLDCTLYKNINHVYFSYSDYITGCKREETNVEKQMYSTFPNWTMMGPISFWVSDVSKVFLEDLHDQMTKMKNFFLNNIPCLQSRRSPYFISSRVFIHNLILDPNRLYKTSGFKSQRDWYLNQTYNSQHTMETNTKSMGNIPTLHFTITA